MMSNYAGTNFHMTFAVCFFSAKYGAPPLLILPGKRFNRDFLEGCNIQGSNITTAPMVFINSTLFLIWIELFANSVTDSVARPLVLVYDVFCSHYNDEIVKKSVELKVILVIFPSNSTHLIRSLDESIFKPFKSVLKHCVSKFMLQNAITTITKKDAMPIGSNSWREGIVSKNSSIDSGFRVSGLLSFYFPATQRRLKLFKDCGIALSEDNPTWMRFWGTV